MTKKITLLLLATFFIFGIGKAQGDNSTSGLCVGMDVSFTTNQNVFSGNTTVYENSGSIRPSNSNEVITASFAQNYEIPEGKTCTFEFQALETWYNSGYSGKHTIAIVDAVENKDIISFTTYNNQNYFQDISIGDSSYVSSTDEVVGIQHGSGGIENVTDLSSYPKVKLSISNISTTDSVTYAEISVNDTTIGGFLNYGTTLGSMTFISTKVGSRGLAIANLKVTETDCTANVYTYTINCICDNETIDVKTGYIIAGDTPDYKEIITKDETVYEWISGTTSAVDENNKVFDIYYSKLPDCSYTIQCVDKEGNVISDAEILGSDFKSLDKSGTIKYGTSIEFSYFKFITESNSNKVLYVCDSTLFTVQKEITSDTTINIGYTKYQGTAYVGEMTSGKYTTTSAYASGGRAYRLTSNTNYSLLTVPQEGNYTVYLLASSSNSSSQTLCNLTTGNDTIISGKDCLWDIDAMYDNIVSTSYKFEKEDEIKVSSTWNRLQVDYVLMVLNDGTYSISDLGWGTYSNSLGVSFDELSNSVSAYYVTSISEESAILEQVTGTIPANTGVLVSGIAGTYKATVSEENTTTTTPEDNLLVAIPGGTKIYQPSEGENYVNYVLGQVNNEAGFYLPNSETGAIVGETFGSGKAYLQISNVDESTAKALSLFIYAEEGNNPDKIVQEVMSDKENKNMSIYTLSGIKTSMPQKGIYIMNGKKIIVK